MINSEIFREYDIRGVVGKELTADFAETLGRAIASYLHKKNPGKSGLKISVGHDARLSCAELQEGLLKGLTESGVSIIKLGMVTSPMSYFSTFTLPVDGGVMITGSHNPPEYNGFKISLGKTTIFGDEIQALLKIIQANDFVKGHGSVETFNLEQTYIEKYRASFKFPKKIKVIVDCGNGVAGVIVKKLYDACGIDAEYLYIEPDGNFPNHHPDPTIEKNMKALQKRVLETGADLGIGFDGDADRIGLIDEKGRLLFGDELMVFFSRFVLEHNKGKTIIGDVKCSDRLYDDIAKHGGVPLMWKTGHSLIKNKMKEIGSPFSGEMSGHVFFADRNFGYDDAIYAGLRAIENLSQSNMSLSQLLSDLPVAYATPEIRIDTTEEKKRRVVDEIKKQFGHGPFKISEIDGIRISYADGFALVRCSNTQPVVVCRFEALTKDRLAEIQNEIEGAVRRLL